MSKYAIIDVKTARNYTEGSDEPLTTDGNGNLNVNIQQGSFSVSTGATYNSTPPTLTNGQTAALQCDSSGALKISGSINATSAATYNSSTQSFSSGTSNALQADAHGSLLVTPRDASGAVQGSLSNPLRTDPTGTTTQPVSGTVAISNYPATQAVSVASLPLPSGAATAAKQPALGTAGSASADVITVQGVASMTALKVDGSAVTQPVSGTFWQATQPVSGTVSVGNFPATQAVSASSLPLPTGAATAARQPAIGTAGSAASDVLTVQGVASMTPLSVSGTFWQTTQPVSGTVTANAGTGTMSVSQQAAAATTATLQSAVSATGNGSSLSVTGMSAVVFTVSGTFTATVTFEGTQDSSNWTSLSATQLGTNTIGTTTAAAGVFEASVAGLTSVRARVTWTSGTSVTVTAQTVPVSFNTRAVNANIIGTVPVSGTFWQATQPVSGTVSITANSSVNVAQLAGTTTDTNSGNKSAGTLRVVIATDQPALTNAQPVSQSGTWTVQPGNTANSTPWLTQPAAGTANGWSVSSQTALTNTKTQIKSSAGNFGGYMFYNPNASVVYIQVWDVANASITVGTTAPTYVIPIPATAGANLEISLGITHATAINVAATTTATGSTAPGTALTGFVIYK